METDVEELALLFRALADPTRLAIVDCLRRCPEGAVAGTDGLRTPGDPTTVGDICCAVAGSPRVTSTLSHHLRELRLAGIVRTTRRGRHVVCALVPERLERIACWLDSHDQNPPFPQCDRC